MDTKDTSGVIEQTKEFKAYGISCYPQNYSVYNQRRVIFSRGFWECYDHSKFVAKTKSEKKASRWGAIIYGYEAVDGKIIDNNRVRKGIKRLVVQWECSKCCQCYSTRKNYRKHDCYC